jgi:hypothetical protein
METHFTGSLPEALNGMPHHQHDDDSGSESDEQLVNEAIKRFAPPKRVPAEPAKPIGRFMLTADSDSEADDDDADDKAPVKYVEVAVQVGSSLRQYTRCLLVPTNPSGEYALHGVASLGKPVPVQDTVLVYVRLDLADDTCPFVKLIRKSAPTVQWEIKHLFVPVRCVFMDIGNASVGLLAVTGAMITPQGGDLVKILFGTGYTPAEMISFCELIKQRKTCDLTPLGMLKHAVDLLRRHGVIAPDYDIKTAPVCPGTSSAADTVTALRAAINDKKRNKRKHDDDDATPRKRPSKKPAAEPRPATPEPATNGKPMDTRADRDATPVVVEDKPTREVVAPDTREDRDATPAMVAPEEDVATRPKAKRRPASSAARPKAAPWLALRSADAPGNGDMVLVFDVAVGHAPAELALVTRLRQVQPHVAFDITLAETKKLTVKCTEANYDAVVAIVNDA